jgi:hypothetical protein
MALFFHGFDFYDGSNPPSGAAINQIFDAGSSTGGFTTGAFGYGRAMSIGSAVNKTFANIPGAGAGQWGTVYLAYHFITSSSGLGDGSNNYITFYDGATVQAVIRVDSSGYIKFYRGNGTTLLGTSSTPITPSVYHYLSIKVVFSATVGAITINLDGATVLSLTGVNTISTADAYSTKIGIMRPGNGSNYEWFHDNLHLYDGTDQAPFNAMLEEKNGRVYFFLPNADGALTGWTASTSPKWSCIDDNPTNSSDYISASTVGDNYSATKPATSNIAAVNAVQLWGYVSKDDATTRGIKLLMRSAAGNNYYGTELLTSATWQFTLYQCLLDPETSAPWTLSAFNSYQPGIQVTT